MPTVYLAPQDLSDEQAQVILDYLNSASSAEEMAARIEIEHELDIGERLAARIINAREALGGQFTQLQQVYDVAYIGPERFTEIAVALLDLQLGDANLPPSLSLSSVFDYLSRLQQELADLKAVVSLPGAANAGGLSTQRQVQITATQTNVFIGQHLTLEIFAYNAEDNTPLVAQRITLSTNWGVLQYQQGYAWQHDAVVEVLTDIEGRAKVRLRSPTFEVLSQEQQLALEAALQTLDSNADTPASIAPQMENLVALYRAPNNRDLRKAVDIYFNSQKTQIIESVNHRFFSDSWQFHNALISAYLHLNNDAATATQLPGFTSNRVESLSTVKVHVKDWVGAWYQTYLDVLEKDNQFSLRIKGVTTNVMEGTQLMNGVLSEISRWSLAELGLAGTIISEKSTEASVRNFLANDIQKLPTQQQLQLYSALSLAVKPTAVTQMGTLQAVADTQLTLADDINTRIGSVENIGALVTGLQANLGSFNAKYNEFQQSFNQFTTDFGGFNTSLSGFNTKLTGFNNQYADFNLKFDSVDSKLTTFNSQYQVFDNRLSDFNSKYSTFGNQLSQFNTQLTATNAQLANFKNDYTSFNTNYSAFNTNYSSFNTNYSSFNTNYAAFNTSAVSLRSEIGALKTNVNLLDARLNTPGRP